MEQFVTILFRLRNRHFLSFDILIFLLTPAVALGLRLDGIAAIDAYFKSLLVVTLAFLVVKVVTFYLGGLYSRLWRYASVDELGRMGLLGLFIMVIQTAVLLMFLLPAGWVSDDFPRSIGLVEGLLAITVVGTVRFSARLSDRFLQPRRLNGDAQRVLVAGAGWAGLTIVREMQMNPHLGLNPVGFVDDDPAKHRVSMRGVRVLGACADIPALVKELQVHHIIIAMPSVPGMEIRRVVNICREAGAQVKIIPGMYELLDGTVHVKHLRDVRIEDLLRRDPIETDTTAIAEMIRGRRVLVTGGGGSIGSEVCRQVLRLNPKSLVVLGHGENSVFEIHNELTRILKSLADEQSQLAIPEIHSVIADIRMIDRLSSIFQRYRPEVVFHAAAHKHVPLMEMNPVEAITNNIMGTRNLLQLCSDTGVERFVLISSDKAVNPTSIMGATKRAAELLTRQTAERTGRPYVAVRFGNVLGSRGSVVLTFQKQILAGGPVTVTDPEMERFFMTIPEAVQLVLQAAALGQGGEVFMLDMGEPVKIADLARDVIKLSGLQVGVDIDIKYTGIRPGEKLYEELFIKGEEYKSTAHEKVFIAATASGFVPSFLEEAVDQLEFAALRADERAIVEGLRDLVPEFRPAGRDARPPEKREDEQLPVRTQPSPALPAFSPALPSGGAPVWGSASSLVTLQHRETTDA